MSSQQRSMVIGVFPAVDQAERAVQELLRAGFRRDDVSFILRDEESPARGDEMKRDTKKYENKTSARYAEGAVAGGLLGGLIGTLTAVALPGIGTILGAGLLIAGMTGAGAIGGVFTGIMSTAGVTEEEARWFEGELEAGRPLVAVRADGRYSEALAILQTNGGYDMSRQRIAQPGSRRAGAAAPH